MFTAVPADLKLLFAASRRAQAELTVIVIIVTVVRQLVQGLIWLKINNIYFVRNYYVKAVG